jgi:hypothetical protein
MGTQETTCNHDVATYRFAGHSEAWAFMKRCDENKLGAGWPQDATVKVALATWMDRELADKLAAGAPVVDYQFASRKGTAS